MRLTKHHGLGNDFLVALLEELPADPPSLAQLVCHRNRGIGADGLVFGLPGAAEAGTDATMVLLNADGSRAEMSGNGIRCLAQAIFLQRREASRGGADALGGELRIGTDAGVRAVVVEPASNPAEIQARVDMGPVGPGPAIGPIHYPGALEMATAQVGNPHLVVLVADVDEVDVAVDGARLASEVPGGINVEFISPRSDHTGINLKVWERGVGVTEACGTGACAAAQRAQDWGLSESPTPIYMPGGEVVVELGDTAILIGPARYIAEVDYPIFSDGSTAGGDG